MAARVRRALGDVARGIAVAVRARPGLVLGAAAAVFALSILLPPALRLHAKLERDAMMVGQGRYFELWDSGVWAAKLGQALSGSGAPPPGMEDFSL